METEVNQTDEGAGGTDLEQTHQFFEIQAALVEHKRQFKVGLLKLVAFACIPLIELFALDQTYTHNLLRVLRTAKDESLRALGDRLNFNDYYNLALEEEEVY
jgi:hypothetical protein